MSDSDTQPSPLSPAEALTRVQDLKLRLEHWHIEDGLSPQQWLTYPQTHEVAGRTFRDVVLAGKRGKRPRKLPRRWKVVVDLHPPPGGVAVQAYRSHDRLTNQSRTLWLLRDLWEGLVSLRGRPEWEHFLRTLDRLLDWPAYTSRGPDPECLAECARAQEEENENLGAPRLWIQTGRQVHPDILADLVEAARLVEARHTGQHLDHDRPEAEPPEAQEIPMRRAPARRAVPTLTDVIISLGERLYKVGDRDPILVTDNEDNTLLTCLEGQPAGEDLFVLDFDKLTDGGAHVSQASTLNRLQTKYEGYFAGAIRLPGRKGGGGYKVRIRRQGGPDENR
jgi:hypothetical protein